MRRLSLLATLLSGCLHAGSHVSAEGTVLGRVVIYRNGVAFYERHATVVDGRLAVHVPRDRVDDFLKPLTVVDPLTRKPLSVSIPRKEADDGSYLTMTLETPEQHADVLLTYVTEAPAWKPSYRVVVGDKGKVMLEGWAIVDNVSGEDWKGVLVGVGASSAMSFRYDLWSVRRIDRDLLQGEDRFAAAPPTGVSPYDAEGGEELGRLESSEVRADGRTYEMASDRMPATGGLIAGVITDTKSHQPLAGVTVIATGAASKETQSAISDELGTYRLEVPAGTYALSMYYADLTLERANIVVQDHKLASVSQAINQAQQRGEVIMVKGAAPTSDPASTRQGITVTNDYTKNVPVAHTFESSLGSYVVDGVTTTGGSSASPVPPAPPPPIKQGDDKLAAIAKQILRTKKDIVIESLGASLGEAKRFGEAARNKLIDDGVPAKRITVAPRTGGSSLRLLAVTGSSSDTAKAPPTLRGMTTDTPVGESHFMADRPMDVRSGSSAMVAMVHGETDGGVVYLYDPIAERGDKRFAFKAVRLQNPTGATLEPGPVTVYGDGRFIGEGITEPVPPRASVVVPFASDRQIVVETAGAEKDKIAKLFTAQRGVITAELQHRKATTYTVTSRLDQPAKVFLRHRTGEAWTVVEAPPKALRVGDSTLYELDLGPKETARVTIAETTPIERSLQLSSNEALDLMKVYIEEPDASPALKKQLEGALATHRTGVDLVDKIATMRDQLGEYKERSGELHAQLVTLKAVRTGGDLMSALRGKLIETTDKVQKLTIKIVDAQEQLMLTKVKFQNELSELHLTDASNVSLSSSR
ncbi:hypothetical protein BH11MYX1_BH11MYX1_20930 [soil metagenome]